MSVTGPLKAISFKDLVTCRYLLKFSYIGTNYTGLQRTTTREDCDRRSDFSVQFQIENAIETQLRPVYGARLSLSSRTDSGVHALVNSGHMNLTHPYANTVYKPSFITYAVNSYLERHDQEIRLLSAQMVANGFNSRSEAKWRTYLYRLAVIESKVDQQVSLDSLLPITQLNRCHVIRGPLDIDSMCRLIEIFKGDHNFASFSPKPEEVNGIVRDPNKTITNFNFKIFQDYFASELVDNSHKISLLCFEITSKSFLYNQIRRMIGSLIDVGLNRFTTEDIKQLLDEPSYKNWRIGQTVAPSKGLWLKNIHYDQEDLMMVDQSGQRINEFANSYPNIRDISYFVQ